MFTEFLAYVGEFLLLISYLTRQMLWLRVVAAIASLCFMSASVFVGLTESGMLPSFIFSTLSFLVNILNIYRLVYTRMPATVPQEYLEVYEKIFKDFLPREFLVLVKFSEEKSFNNTTIIEENADSDLYLIVSGTVQILQQNKVVATIPSSNMIGEISYLTSQKTMATVKAIGPVTTLSWTPASVTKLEKKYEHIYLKFHNVLLCQTRNKLIKQNAIDSIN